MAANDGVDARTIAKGAAAGVIAGIAASWAANQFHSLWSGVRGEEKNPAVARLSQRGGRPDTQEAKERVSRGIQPEREPQDATIAVAEKISGNVLGHPLSQKEKHPAGVAVHYVFGALSGAFYGAAAEVVPAVTVLKGAGFGIAVWMAGVEIALPIAGLAKPPWRYPFRMHAYSFVSHLVYGGVTEGARAKLRKHKGQVRRA